MAVSQVRPELESDAFRQAVLRSEQRRIIGTASVLGALACMVIIRSSLSKAGAIDDWALEGGTGVAARSLALVVAGCAYELLMLAFVRRAIRIGRDIPGWVWPVNIFIETMMPTVALLMLAHAEFSHGYRALVAPAVFVYFFFIILSSLRLRPGLCLLTGLLSALSYAAVIEYVYRQFPDPDQTLAVVPRFRCI